ncbi:DUF3164 family protein [Pseudophaeobacter sp.]|jgi:hypothetical protein|uniref:DUF3164 family protein n=1 Tax=Pseudophaeobacter sp. TaxID=1971739 RepID=UPI003267B9CD
MTNAQNPTPETPFEPAKIPDGVVMVDGKEHRTDTKGSLVPIALVKPRDLLQDETTRKIIGYAIALSEQVSRFKAHVAEDISLFEEILALEYEARIGGPKGNKTIMSYDGLFRVSVRTADKYEFGPELQVAKSLVDECMNEWAADARDELKVIVTEAFDVNKEGEVSRAALLRLKKWNIEDERWLRAMQAIKDAEREVGKATYFHCHRRKSTDAPWEAITIDLAKA